MNNEQKNMDKLEHNERFGVGVSLYGHENAAKLGPYASHDWYNDPKHLLFIISRYKFCARMLEGHDRIADFGCGDGTGMPILLQSVTRVVGVDIVPEVINYNQQFNKYPERVEYKVHNIIKSPLAEPLDAAISMDVIEHVEHKDEDTFIANIAKSLKANSPCIIGTPNITAQDYASESSRHEHINLKSHASLKTLMLRHFHSVFLFSMNDEVLHTGFHAMSHYIFALAVNPKN